MNQLVVRARELLRMYSKDFVIEKMTREKTTRQTATSIKRAVEEATKSGLV